MTFERKGLAMEAKSQADVLRERCEPYLQSTKRATAVLRSLLEATHEAHDVGYYVQSHAQIDRLVELEAMHAECAEELLRLGHVEGFSVAKTRQEQIGFQIEIARAHLAQGTACWRVVLFRASIASLIVGFIAAIWWVVTWPH